MGHPEDYNPPKVWKWEVPSGGTFSKINKPTSGPTHKKKLNTGIHPIQLYSQGTPNGVKVTVCLRNY